MIKIKGKAAGLYIDDKGALHDRDGVVHNPAHHSYLWFHESKTGLDGSKIEVFRAGTEKGDFIRCITKGKSRFWDLWRSALSNEHEAYTKPAAPSASLMKKRTPQLKDPMDGGMFTAPATANIPKPKDEHAGEKFRLVNRESGSGDQTPPKAKDVVTKAMEQFAQFEQKHPGFIILMRIGDFYETFGESAKTLSAVCGTTLTKRGDVAMAGVPYHAVENHLKQLIAAGHKAALADPVEVA